jgi:hypothetical protein
MPQHGERVDDDRAHERAMRHLAAVIGTERPPEVRWDPDYHLQGHVDVASQHLVVIAARDGDHAPLVLSEADWDALRRGCVTAA